MPFSIEEEEKRKEKENINLEKIDIENINLGLKDYTGIVTGIKCKNFVKKMTDNLLLFIQTLMQAGAP